MYATSSCENNFNILGFCPLAVMRIKSLSFDTLVVNKRVSLQHGDPPGSTCHLCSIFVMQMSKVWPLSSTGKHPKLNVLNSHCNLQRDLGYTHLKNLLFLLAFGYTQVLSQSLWLFAMCLPAMSQEHRAGAKMPLITTVIPRSLEIPDAFFEAIVTQ